MKHAIFTLLLACLSGTSLVAQNPVLIPALLAKPQSASPESSCNFAGTLHVEDFIGQSVHNQLYSIVLCFGDSILIRHNGDADLSGDPIPSTPAGIVYPFYVCSPSISGPSLLDLLGDPCLLPGSASGMFVTQGIENGGSTWFYNDGTLQNAFNAGQPISLFFAPATIDSYLDNSYEPSLVGGLPGPCVDVNLAEAFEVVYLNKISATGINNQFTDDCIGKFTISGGYPQYDPTASYSVEVSLASNPSVKGQVFNLGGHIFHLSNVLFSVPQAGTYTISVEDQNGCGYQFQMNMSACNPSDNASIDIGSAGMAGAGSTVCLPITVRNFSIKDAVFSISWDTSLLKYNGLDNINPDISAFFDPVNHLFFDPLNPGTIGVTIFNPAGSVLHLSDGDTLFHICFEVLSASPQNCSQLRLFNSPMPVNVHDENGILMAVSSTPGLVCKTSGNTAPIPDNNLWLYPNPLPSGQTAWLNFPEGMNASEHTLSILDSFGKTLLQRKAGSGPETLQWSIPSEGLRPGVYFIRAIDTNGHHKTIKFIVL